MVLLTLVDGKKGPGDILVLVTSYNEPMSIADVLFLLDCQICEKLNQIRHLRQQLKPHQK